MDAIWIDHHLRGLSEIDVTNLRCGWITRIAMREALSRERELPDTYRVFTDTRTGICPMRLADILNDMREAARLKGYGNA